MRCGDAAVRCGDEQQEAPQMIASQRWHPSSRPAVHPCAATQQHAETPWRPHQQGPAKVPSKLLKQKASRPAAASTEAARASGALRRGPAALDATARNGFRVPGWGGGTRYQSRPHDVWLPRCVLLREDMPLFLFNAFIERKLNDLRRLNYLNDT